jgi:hypothetical protein
VVGKSRSIFGGNYFQRLLEIIFDRYFRRNRQKFLDRQKYFWPTFSGFFLSAENNTDLFSVVFLAAEN